MNSAPFKQIAMAAVIALGWFTLSRTSAKQDGASNARPRATAPATAAPPHAQTPAEEPKPASRDDVEAAAADEVPNPASGVIGGPHDFSRFSNRVADACSVCHVPHVQGAQADKTPAGQATLDLYRIEGQRQVFIPGRYMPGPTSLICLSCHNGTVADSTMSTSHAMLSGERIGLGVPDDFAFRDHPIGIAYPTEPRDYRPAGFVERAGVPLPQGRIECISCHDPHNEHGHDDMLVISNRRSALCLTCHKK